MRNSEKRACFVSFSHENEKVIHMRKQKRKEAKKEKAKKEKKVPRKESEISENFSNIFTSCMCRKNSRLSVFFYFVTNCTS
jgi:hypothetical protein